MSDTSAVEHVSEQSRSGDTGTDPVDPSVNANGEDTTEDDKSPLQKLRREFYPYAQLQEKGERFGQVAEICKTEKAPFHSNCEKVLTGDEAQKDGWGIAIIPQTERQKEKGNVVIGVSVVAMPEPETILSSGEAGQTFVREAVIDKLMNRAANFATQKKLKALESIEAFIETLKKGEQLATYNDIAPDVVKALKAQGMKTMTNVILRSCLQSRAQAETQYPNVSQEMWVTVLQKMNEIAKTKKLDPSTMQNWLETRDQTEAAEFDDDDITKALASLTGEETQEQTAA